MSSPCRYLAVRCYSTYWYTFDITNGLSPMKPSARTQAFIDQYRTWGAPNYSPLEVVLVAGSGAFVTDIDGVRYLDMLSGYSALNFGHAHPRLVAAAATQMGRLAVTSRAFYNDQLGPFCEELATLCRQEMVLPMNSGAEAVETALKCARRWGYQVKGVAADSAQIIAFSGNFAGRTISICSFSDQVSTREDFGPFTPGFTVVPYGDLERVRQAIGPNTVGVIVEPIQGEGGVIIPPPGFLKGLSELCAKERVLFIADEIQTGLCRTGDLFCIDHDGVTPDLMTLGKSLGGGIVPISALVGSRQLLGLFGPGSHGSTFGGNPLACAIGREVIRLIREEKPQERARLLGDRFRQRLAEVKSPVVQAVRGRGLFIGVDIDPRWGPAKNLCKLLLERRILCKDTRHQTIRFSPPLVIEEATLMTAAETIAEVLEGLVLP